MFKLWREKHFAFILWPLSIVYQLIVALRYLCYRMHVFKVTRFNVPIIVVGNITVGGTGKTPIVLWLAEFLRREGFKPGIVSRGYGGESSHYPQIVTANSNAGEVGDESLLIAKRSEVPVVVDPKRVRAVKTLLEQFNCNVVVSDDGLQHYALARDIEIAVIDSQYRFGNGFCLPAGPLREPLKRLARVDLSLTGGEPQAGEMKFDIVESDIIQLSTQQCYTIDDFKEKKVQAIAGIANPERFFNFLTSLGLTFEARRFPDHYRYCRDDFFEGEDDIILMTEKDAVKCDAFADERFYYLPITAVVPEDFAVRVRRLLREFNLG